ncbi:hypothetical protein CAEBREN_11329 [Caenorhabditis brenneri]|uniref:DUF281 domain-containing protein n=1 Tax=Caenorhabditis brenneri TaxID=135651 RepID=G0PF65_CAEBE|nr:hypothetical protein CAEBREN_11329 [Caenorhabditis brenneri]
MSEFSSSFVSCARCDPNVVAVPGLPPGQELLSAIIPDGDCIAAIVQCRTNEPPACKRIEMLNQNGDVMGFNRNTGATGNNLVCGDDGWYPIEGGDSRNAADCMQTEATCTRDDGRICDSVQLQGDGGVVLGTATNTDSVTATLTCVSFRYGGGSG